MIIMLLGPKSLISWYLDPLGYKDSKEGSTIIDNMMVAFGRIVLA